MRNTTAILAALAVLVTASACGADHVLDRAGQALSEGDAVRAAEIYRQANAELPTSEGYNNLGVALERSGKFADATEAYGESLRLPEADRRTETNLQRARFRALAQAGLPYAACVFAALVVTFVLVWLARRLAQARRAWKFRARSRAVRVLGLTHRVQCHDGQCQPDGRAYADSESISLQAGLVLPAGPDTCPFQVELEVLRPDGAVWRTLKESIKTAEAKRMTIRFNLNAIEELLTHSGTWKARLVLRNINKVLAATTFTVVTRANLLADLKATDVRLVAIRGKETASEQVIFPDVEAIVPCAVIRPRSYHPSKFDGMRLRVNLVNVDKQGEVESQEFPLELADGAMEFCSISRPVAGNEIARKVGHWEFRLSVGGRQLARIPFVITSFEQALESLEVESFEIVGFPSSGQAARIADVVYTRNLRSLCPVMTVTSGFPSSGAKYPVDVGVCLDGELVDGAEGTLVMNRGVVELIPGEFAPPRIPEGRESIRVGFVFRVKGRMLAIREVTLRPGPPGCADAQGRIGGRPLPGGIDYDHEAARILGEARIA